MKIKGLQKLSLIDFSPFSSCVIFLCGCNFRCGFCHNPEIVEGKGKDISEDELFKFLAERKKWLDGVCITGGEPCINEELIEFIKKIKDMGYKVKVDTNGTNPLMVEKLVKTADYIAMDIKTSPGRYDKATGVEADIVSIKKSAKIIMESEIDYEFRITVVPGILDKEDIVEIGKWLKGAKNLFIQQFSNKICLDKSFEKVKPYSLEELDELKRTAEPYFGKVEIRS
ncbi:MAG TPA: anaerobic ribonucleoside-triphosphate reductase activating protein [Candidatus Nanoarchaeia archaeon]|nr:anaerobic ribonucleoside-triphosphate reductase activating protein [Candidatus Nanoarchaeia archaeon]